MINPIRIVAIFIYTLVSLFLLFEMALQVSPGVMSAHLMRDFDIDSATFGLMSSVYFLGYTVMQLPVGLLYDRYSARIVITSSVFACTLGIIVFTITQSVLLAGFGRFLMGMGSAFAFIGVLVVASRWFPQKYFALLVGIAQFLAAIGAFLGEVPVAALLDQFEWQIIMVFFIVIGLVLTILSFMIIRDSPSRRRVLEKHHVIMELKQIIRNAQTWWIAAYALFSWGPIIIFAALWGIPYLSEKFHISTIDSAFAMGCVWLGVGVTSPLIGWISDKIKRRCILMCLTSCIGLFSTSLLLYMPNISFVMTCFLLLGLGVAASGQILTFALVKDINRLTMTGTAIGLNNMAAVAGGVFFQPFVGFVLSIFGSKTLNTFEGIKYATSTYEIGLTIVPVCFLIGALISGFKLKETHCKPLFPYQSDGKETSYLF